jgi:hypothetical protein
MTKPDATSYHLQSLDMNLSLSEHKFSGPRVVKGDHLLQSFVRIGSGLRSNGVRRLRKSSVELRTYSRTGREIPKRLLLDYYPVYK